MSQPPEVPSGPCPAEPELAAAIGKLIDDVGAQNLTFRTLRTRLEVQFNVNMTPYREVMDRLVEAKIMEPRTHKKMKEYKDAKAAGLVQTGQKKRKKKGARTTQPSAAAGSPDKARSKKSAPKVARQEGEPKKALGAYFLFANDARAKVKQENPSLSITEVAGKVGELWAALSEDEKAKYKQRALEDKARYERELETFRAAGGEVASTRRGGKEKAKVREGPKRPVSAYFAFLAARRPAFVAANPGKSTTEISTALGAEWNALADKSEFERIAEADRQRYERECASAGISVKKAAKRKRVEEVPDGDASSTASSSGSSSDSDSSSSDSDSDSDSSSSSSSSSASQAAK